MHPTLNIGSATVSTYTVLLFLGCVVGSAIGYLRARRDDLSGRLFLVIAAVGIVGGLLGAHLWSALVEVGTLTGRLEAANLLRGSGLSIMGGLLLGGSAAALAARLAGVSLRAWLDAASPGAAAGIAVGRIGCLMAGCCHGKPTLFPIALVFDRFDTVARPIGVPLHATQIYESLGAAALAAGLFWMPARPPAHRVCLFVAGYGLLRAVVETLRADYRGLVVGIPATLLAALLAACVGIAAIVYLRIASRVKITRST